MEDLLNGYFLQVLVFICINTILALTIYMTLCTGLVSLGNAGFMSFGAYTSAILTMKMGLPMPAAILCGGIVAAAVALIIGIPTIRLRGLYLAIATLGFGEVVRVIALNMKITNGALGLSGIPSMASSLSSFASDAGLIDALGIDSQTAGQFLMCIALIILVTVIFFFWYRLEHSRIGRAFAAIKADEYAASLSGINVVYYKMMSFLFSAFFAGVAGALYAHATFFISPTDFTWHKVVDMLLYTVFGGSNVMWGPLLGATVLTIVPESLRAMSEYRDIIYGLMLVILMDFRPDGILSYDAVKYISRRLKNRRKGASDRASGNEKRSQEIRRHHGAVRHFLQRRKRRHLRHHRAERRREDDYFQYDHRGLSRDVGRCAPERGISHREEDP